MLSQKPARRVNQATQSRGRSSASVSPQWQIVSERINLHDKTVQYDGKAMDFPALRTYLTQAFGTYGIGDLLLPLLHRPRVPEEFRTQDGSPLTFEMGKYNSQIREEARRINGMYTKGASLITGKLTGTPLSDCMPLMTQNVQPSAMFNNILDTLMDNYGQNTDTAATELLRKLNTCPMVNTAEEAKLFQALMAEVDLDLTTLDANRALTESFKRQLCIQKLGEQFNTIVEKIDGDPHANQVVPPMTWAQITAQLRSKGDLERVRATALFTKDTLGSTSSSSSSSPTPLVQDKDGVDDYSMSGASSSLINNVAGRVCDNCSSPDHYIRNCTTFCTQCDPQSNLQLPHHPNHCEWRRSSGGGKGRGGQGRGNYGRGRGGAGRGGGGYGRGGAYSGSYNGSQSRGGKGQQERYPGRGMQQNIYQNVRPSGGAPDTKRQRSVSAVFGVDYGQEEAFGQDSEANWQEEDDFTYETAAYNHMACATLPAWSKTFLEAHHSLSVLLPAVCEAKCALMVAAASAFRRNGHCVQASFQGKSVEFSLFFLGTVWECHTRSVDGSSSGWRTRAMLTSWHSLRAAARRRRKAHRRLMCQVRRHFFVANSTLTVDPPTSGRGVLPCLHWNTRFSSRRYLEECAHFRSCRRGRGRNFQVPWWSVPTTTPPVVLPSLFSDFVQQSPLRFVVLPSPSVSDDDASVDGDNVYSPDLPELVSDSDSDDEDEDGFSPPRDTGSRPSRIFGVPFQSFQADSDSDSDDMPGFATDSSDSDVEENGDSEFPLFGDDFSEHRPAVLALCYHLVAHSEGARSLSAGMLDSGANLSISNPHLAVMLQLTPRDWPRPIPIRFGNSSDCLSTQYVDLGPLIGRVALVESAQTTILTKQSLHQCGVSVLFRSDHVCRLIQDYTGEVLFETTLERPDDFFMIPLQSLLPPDLGMRLNTYLNERPAVQEAHNSAHEDSQLVVNGRRALPVVTAVEIAAVMALHQRMYHPSSAVMAQALRDGAWTGVDISPTLVERVFQHRDCLFCALGKMKRIPRPVGSSIKPTFGHEISVDYLPITTTAKGNFTGAYVLVERSVGYGWAFLTSKNNQQQLRKAVCHVRSCLLKHMVELKVVRTDAGRVEASQDLAAALAELHVEITSAAPAAQYQNFVERFIQTVVHGIATTLVAQQFLDNSFWGMALLAWIRAWNCRPNRTSAPFSPEFHLTGRHPNVAIQFKHAFGSPVVSRILPPRAGKKGENAAKFKFQPSGELGYVVGNTASINGASLVFFPNKGSNLAFPRVDIQALAIKPSLSDRELATHLASLKVTNEEITLPTRSAGPSPLAPSPVATPPDSGPLDTSAVDFADLVHSEALRLSLNTPLPVTSAASLSLEDGLEVEEPVASVDGAPLVEEITDQEGVTVPLSSDTHQEGGLDPEPMEESTVDEPPVTGAAHGYSTRYSMKRAASGGQICSVTRPASPNQPSDTPTLGQALKSVESEQWVEAIRIEIKALLDHNTGTEVQRPSIPTSAQIVPVKVVLRLKRDAEGRPIKYKARLCVLGNLVQKSMTSVFAPTANAKSLMLLLALATALGLSIRSIDVYGAFLYPDQKEETFIQLPPTITGGQNIYWRLNKTMYGLPSSPKAFYEHVSAHLLVCGYTRCTSDPCFFWKRSEVGYLFTVVHVDDFVVAASVEEMLNEFVTDLEKIYVVSVSKDVNHFLGLHIRDSPMGSRLLSQPGLLKKLFEAHPGVTQMTSLPTVPMSSTFDDAAQSDAVACDPHAFMELLGSLLYVVKTRPDIAYAVNRMAMRAKEATIKDMNSLQRILAYLYGTRSLGIHLMPQTSPEFVLEGWCDAAYAVHPDGKSHTGYGFTHVGSASGLFYSRSCKQINVALSSTEAELNAAVDAVKDVIWFRELLSEMGYPQTAPTPLYVDNASLITLASEYSGNHKRVKHFLVRLNFLIDQVQTGTVKFVKVHTDLNTVDGLTKPLGPTAMFPKRDLLLGIAL